VPASSTTAPGSAASAAGPGPVALRLERVRKSFGGAVAVAEVSLEVRAGEILALLGENGAGKSTLVGMAAGRIAPDSGTIAIDGVDVTGGTPKHVAAAGLRLVPQELLNCPDLSVLDNVLLGQRPRRAGLFLDRRRAASEARRRLERLGVELKLSMPVGDLPVADQAFVQIARGLAEHSRVLILDEPTAPMDDVEVSRFLDVVAAVAASGVAIVYISHRLDEVFQIADRIAVLRDGRLAAEFVTRDTDLPEVIAAMVGGREIGATDHIEDGAAGPVILQANALVGRSVKGIDLELRAGEVLCIYGAAGSGREEIGALLVGASRRTSGQVLVSGFEMPVGGLRHAVRRGLGYVPPERRSQGLVFEASIAVNVTLAILRRMARWGFVSPREPRRRTLHWLERLRIKSSGPDAQVSSLSGGSQQKVLVARWLAAGSQILVLEEPTRGVDIATKAEMYRLFAELAREGKAVLVITSDIEEATLTAKNVTVLRGGRVVATLRQPTQEAIALAAHGAEEDFS
jgi:ABC-type sugar transport system ATPase subunit